MARFARLDGSRVVEIVAVPDDLDIADLYHPDIAATMQPAGDGVTEGMEFDGTNFSAPAPVVVAPTADAVIAERARRLALGFDHDFGGARGVHRIGTTAADMVGWQEVTSLATARHGLGSAQPIAIVTDTGPVEVTPAEWLEVLEAAGAFRQPIWGASFQLQAADPIPSDFTDDAYWP